MSEALVDHPPMSRPPWLIGPTVWPRAIIELIDDDPHDYDDPDLAWDVGVNETLCSFCITHGPCECGPVHIAYRWRPGDPTYRSTP